MRVMLACKALVVATYRRKLAAIARAPDVELIAIAPPSWRDPAYAMQLEESAADGYELLVSPIAANGNYHLYYFPELPHLLDRYRPDILHIDEEPYNLATFLAVWQATRRGIPSVFFAWQNLRRRYPPPFCWMEGYVYRHAAWGIGGTDAAVQVLEAKGFRGRSAVIPQFGTDPTEFEPLQSRPDRPFTIGFAGRLVPEKGLGLLMDACARLTCDFRLLVVGEGTQRRALESQAAELGIKNHVQFEGSVASSAMPRYLHEMDAVVLPSVSTPSWTEQFGRVLVEAMACGIPVVGSTCGEIPSVIGGAGLVFPEGDEAALSAALMRLAVDPALRAALGKAGRERVVDCFTHDRVAERTVDVYRNIVGQVSSRRDLTR